MNHDEIMQRVWELAAENVAKGGWPFAAIIARDGGIIAEAVNAVHESHDPSDHAEIAAIRIATKKIKSPNLTGYKIYALGMPCPMCMGCILLSQLDEIIYAVATPDKDKALSKLPLTQALYNELAKPPTDMAPHFTHLSSWNEKGIALFQKWNQS